MKTKWYLSEPNLESACRKNNSGLCAMHGCENSIGNSPYLYGFYNVKVCSECKSKINVEIKKMQRASDEDFMEMLTWIANIT